MPRLRRYESLDCVDGCQRASASGTGVLTLAGWREQQGARHGQRERQPLPLRSGSGGTSISAMPRKPEVPSIPEPPARQSKPATRMRAIKARSEKEPEPPVAMPDLWEAFGAGWGLGEPVEAAAPSQTKPRRRSSGKR
jgi:hypothetical protein